MAVPVQVVFDCADPNRLARFWAEVLGYTFQDPPKGFASWEDWMRSVGIPEAAWNDASAVVDPEGKGPRLFFQRVPEGKLAKNRVHLDVNVGGRGTPDEERRRRIREAVDKALALGATQVEEREMRGEHWVVMQDPEGNEFCFQ